MIEQIIKNKASKTFTTFNILRNFFKTFKKIYLHKLF